MFSSAAAPSAAAASMFPKSLRLSRRDFLSVKSSGKSLSFTHFSVIYVSRSPGRVAIVTSAKLSKSAVVRNQLRRRVYSVFPQIPYDVILFPKASMLKLGHAKINSELDSLVSKISH